MDAVFIGFLGLGLSVTFHVLFTAMTLGVGLISAWSRHMAYKTGDPWYEVFARKTFKLLIVSELFSGVWGTIITVFLAGFFTALLTLATNTLFIPLAIAVASIMIRIPAIAASWYTWGKISPRSHTMLMWIMALSGFGVPLGFRAIFAEINYPHAITYYLQTGNNPGFMPYTNPLFWTLYLHTVAAVISVGGFVIASLAILDRDVRGAQLGVKLGFTLLIAQLAFGPLYWLSLSRYSPLLFNAVNTTYAPILAVKLVTVALLAVLGYKALKSLETSIPGNVKWLGPLALLAVALGEVLNDGSRYPNMVLMDNEGLPVSLFANFYMDIPLPMVYMILAFLVLSIVVFTVAAYYAIYRRFIAEVPEELS
ncbi:MAG: cytochrome ubiquinol oxidase subunit I [Thermoprotei archaeon]|nr:cytochrome ubiquinol oxidase subunit I [Thermoprotei archaeon]